MRGRLFRVALYGLLHLQLGKFPAVPFRHQRQIRRGYLQRAGGQAIAFTVHPVADGTMLPEQILARKGRRLRGGRGDAEADRQQAKIRLTDAIRDLMPT